MSKIIDRDELVIWLDMWITEQQKEGNTAESRELIFVRDTLKDDNWALLKEQN
jgi:hypothetical protein